MRVQGLRGLCRGLKEDAGMVYLRGCGDGMVLPLASQQEHAAMVWTHMTKSYGTLAAVSAPL